MLPDLLSISTVIFTQNYHLSSFKKIVCDYQELVLTTYLVRERYYARKRNLQAWLPFINLFKERAIMMRTAKRMRNISCLFILLISFADNSASEPVAEIPTYAEGDYWIFVSKTTEGSEDIKIEFLKEEKGHSIFSRNGEQFKDFHDIVKKSQPAGYPGPTLKFPLTVGKSWDVEFKADIGPGDTIKDPWRVAQYKLEAYEQITVPAGTFWAFNISVGIETKKLGKFMGSINYWYAPEVKQIIKRSGKGGNADLQDYKTH